MNITLLLLLLFSLPLCIFFLYLYLAGLFKNVQNTTKAEIP